MNRSRPPFAVVAGQSAAEAAVDILDAFAGAASRGDDRLQWTEREATRDFAATTDPAMAASGRASRAIACAIDAEAPRADRLPYHNRQHFCEVMLVACFLGRLHRFAPRDAQRLVLAALVHDLDHDGQPDGDFGAERRSLERARPFLREAGVDAGEVRRLEALVLSTEPNRGVRTAVRAAAGQPPVELPPSASALEALFADRSLARQAARLVEADILPSAGLTVAHGMALQERLAAEWQRPLGVDDKRRFLDRVLDAGIVGDFFLPNLKAFRARLADEPVHG